MATFFVILILAVAFGSAVALALVQNARDADEAWEDAMKDKQNKDIK
jgi:hypothetical protein